DGISMLPTWLGKPQKQGKHDYLYWEFHEQGKKQAARMGKWKGIRVYRKGGEMELYDLSRDMGEENNVADRHPEIVKKLARLMDQAHADDSNWPIGKK
ncbi:DUF4976 domain-containing protein, partial [bacterium]|nr:DUF4976 domain-containing protein [bacterium]